MKDYRNDNWKVIENVVYDTLYRFFTIKINCKSCKIHSIISKEYVGYQIEKCLRRLTCSGSKLHFVFPSQILTPDAAGTWLWASCQIYIITSTEKLTFIYSLETLWYFVRNLDVIWFFISSISTGLRTCTNVAQEHMRSDALPDTTVVRWESNTGPLIWKTHALPIAPRPEWFA